MILVLIYYEFCGIIMSRLIIYNVSGGNFMTIDQMKVLISDDSVFARKKLKDYILSLGAAEVLEANDGQEAIDLYKENKPDVVFMDIIMPKKTGIEAVKEILAFDKNAKVVMASSVGTQKYLKDAITAGAYEFLQKPIDNNLVQKILQNIVKEG